MEDKTSIQLFRNDGEGYFVQRVNRFEVKVRDIKAQSGIGKASEELRRAEGDPIAETALVTYMPSRTASSPERYLMNPQASEPELSKDERTTTTRIEEAGGLKAKIVSAHCPNPGRLIELLYPDTRVILEARMPNRSIEKIPFNQPEDGPTTEYDPNQVFNKEDDPYKGTSVKNNPKSSPTGVLDEKMKSSGKKASEKAREKATEKERKTLWTMVAVYAPSREKGCRERVVPLFASRMNRLTEELILPRLFPKARNIKREARWGSSQFDFLVQDAEGNKHYVEVKGCTQVEYGIAMFPDAPSIRATRHLKELAEVTKQGFQAHLVLVFSHGPAERFIPNLHTDPLFAATLAELSPPIQIHTAEIAADTAGQAWVVQEGMPADLSHGNLARENRGSYLLSLYLKQKTELEIGALGRLQLKTGWYVYAGSAQRGLSHRIARHLRKERKQFHWHIDYLSAVADKRIAYPIASYRNLECSLAQDLKSLGGVPIQGFGSSDCGCYSHLYFFPAESPPRDNPRFVQLLLWYRHREAFVIQ
ncbi:MAG: DNA/RNA nuclease SfsA [Spirochaetales bacterium]